MGKKSDSVFGDKRLEKAFLGLLTQIEKRNSVLLSKLSETRSEEAQFGRFVNNKKVNPDRLLAQYWKSSQTNWSGKHLLMVNDTSTVSYKVRENCEQLGPLTSTNKKEGFDIHPTIMLDADTGSCYGLGGINFFQNHRSKNEEEEAQWQERRKKCYELPFEEKRSFKWFSSPRTAIQNCLGADRYTLIGDRESDTYELMDRTLSEGWDFVYRSKQNRIIVEAKDEIVVKRSKKKAKKTLYSTLKEWEVSHSYFIDCNKTSKRSAHEARLEMKFGKVAFKRPSSRNKAKLRERLPLHVVEVQESVDTVQPGEPPIRWILLTSHVVDSVEDALQVIQWYRWRWVIEQCFRTLKLQGLDIESAMMRTYHGLKNMCTLALTAALQVMQLVQARDGKSKEEAAHVFLPEERQCIEALNEKVSGRTEKSRNPYPPQSLAFAAWVIARLGGWKGYEKRKPPGPITFIIGLTRFYNTLEGFYLMQELRK